MKPIGDIKKDLLDWIGKGIDLALNALKNTIPADVPKYKDVIMLEGRYRELHKNWLEKGVLSDEEALVESNKIQEAIINFINDLKEEDLVKELAEKIEQKAKTGKVLYRVPDQMQVEKEVKCIIRVAFTEDILLQDIEQEADDTIKDVRIADVMAAEIIDPNEQPAFAIRTFSERVQFIDESDFTEWLFYVKPLLEGSYPLLLKVAIVEIVDGKERKREVVMEETIQVISTEPEKAKEEFAEVKDVQVAGFAQAKNETAAAGKKGILSTPLGMVATVVVAMTAIFILYTVISPRFFDNKPNINLPQPGGEKSESERWEEIRDLQDTIALKQFLEDFPESEFADEALEKLEILRFAVVFEQKGDSLLFSAKGGQAPLQLILLKEGETILEKRINSVDEIVVFQRDMNKMPIGEYQVILIDANDITTGTTVTVTGDDTATDTKTQDKSKTAQKTSKPPVKPKPSTSGKTGSSVNKTTETADKGQANQEETSQTGNGGTTTNTNTPTETYVFKNMEMPPLYKRCANKRRKRAIECTEETIRYTIERELERLPEVQQKKVKGMLNVVFIINEKGIVSVKSILPNWGDEFNEKVRKIVEDLPQFEPGQNALGMPVSVQYSLPIRFQ